MQRHLLNEENINIRWTDMDAYHHVAHQTYFDYLTEARHAELIRPFLPNQKEKFFLVDISCDFKKALEYPGKVTVKQYLVAKGNSSFTLEFEFYNEQQQLTNMAFATLVSVDLASGDKVSIPEYLNFPDNLAEKYPVEPLAINDQAKSLLTKTVPMRYADIDAFRHVNNTRYFDFMLEARHALFPDNNPLAAECLFFIIKARCQFFKPLFYPGDVNLDLYLTHSGNTSFTFGYNIYQNDAEQLHAIGSTTLVCIDKDSLKPIRPPESVLAIIK